MNEELDRNKEISKAKNISKTFKTVLVLVNLFILYGIGDILSVNIPTSSNLNFIVTFALLVLSFLFVVIFLPIININISLKKTLIILFIVLFIPFFRYLIFPIMIGMISG